MASRTKAARRHAAGRLSLDTLDGQAWLTRTAVRVERSRRSLVPPLRGVSNFVETTCARTSAAPTAETVCGSSPSRDEQLVHRHRRQRGARRPVPTGVGSVWPPGSTGTATGPASDWQIRRPRRSVTVEPHDPGDLANDDLSRLADGTVAGVRRRERSFGAGRAGRARAVAIVACNARSTPRNPARRSESSRLPRNLRPAPTQVRSPAIHRTALIMPLHDIRDPGRHTVDGTS